MNYLIQLIGGCFIIAWGFWIVATAIPFPKPEDYIKKSEVVKCFDGIDWSRQYFYCRDNLMTDTKDNKKFYPSKEIDTAIKKLNDKLAN